MIVEFSRSAVNKKSKQTKKLNIHRFQHSRIYIKDTNQLIMTILSEIKRWTNLFFKLSFTLSFEIVDNKVISDTPTCFFLNPSFQSA